MKGSERGRDRGKNVRSYNEMLRGVMGLLETARRASVRAVNSVMTATYWEIGRRIVEFEQHGFRRARYGRKLIDDLSRDLTRKLGRGFSAMNLRQMRRFFELWPHPRIQQTLSIESRSSLERPRDSKSSNRFPLPWSHYTSLMRVEEPRARKFYEVEAFRAGWSVRQLERQISSLFFERMMLSRDKGAMLLKGGRSRLGDRVTPEEEIKDPLVLEFLDLKDEYSESDLEDGLVRRMEAFLLELGSDFAFVGRQRRLRIGDEWFRVDLLFFHRRLKCLLVIDLKLGRFTHADAGQMHMYLNYAREHWTHPGENSPVGLVLCARGNSAVAKYVLPGLGNRILAAEYKLSMPSENALAAEVEKTRRRLEGRSGT